MKNKLIIAAGVAAFAASAYANPESLTLDINGSTTGTLAPNPVSGPGNDTIIYINGTQTVGVFEISGFGELQNASTLEPVLDLDTLTLKTTGASAGPLTIELLYSGFTTPSGGISLVGGNNGAISGTTGNIEWAFSSDLDSGNGIGLLLTLNSLGKQNSPVSLDGTLSVPDGGMTVAMLGMGLGVCGLFVRKLRRA